MVTGLLMRGLFPPHPRMFSSSASWKEAPKNTLQSQHLNMIFLLFLLSSAALKAVYLAGFVCFLLLHFAVQSSSDKSQAALLLLGLIKLKTLFRVSGKFMKLVRKPAMINGFYTALMWSLPGFLLKTNPEQTLAVQPSQMSSNAKGSTHRGPGTSALCILGQGCSPLHFPVFCFVF